MKQSNKEIIKRLELIKHHLTEYHGNYAYAVAQLEVLINEIE
jgi:hypothetical protein